MCHSSVKEHMAHYKAYKPTHTHTKNAYINMSYILTYILIKTIYTPIHTSMYTIMHQRLCYGTGPVWATSYDVRNRCVLTLPLNEETESEERTDRGREFQTVGAEWENDLWPKVTVRTDGMERVDLSAEDRRDLAGT